jgi:amino acid adenylation domain-containing protein
VRVDRPSVHALLARSAERYPDRVAVDDPGQGTITYAELDRLSGRVRDRLRHLGVTPGDRVGVVLRKSVDSVACIFGAMRAGAAYVPVDAEAPAARAAHILSDCSVRVLVTHRHLEPTLREALAEKGADPFIVSLEPAEENRPLPLEAWLREAESGERAPEVDDVHPDSDALAYILYTSGSTGRPKGVMLSHGNALSFVDWCSETFEPGPKDVFSSHAPFHFDLSILDLYLSLKHGARLVLIGEEAGKEPLSLAQLIADKGITVWYSTPSILNFLATYGRLERHDFGALRLVLFAGEVFPPGQLRALQAHWPAPRYFNLYGPTETNVCTWYEVAGTVPDDRVEPYPIGTICPPNLGRVVEPDGSTAGPGEEGELVVAGPNVMMGYWNLPELNARVFLTDGEGRRWYRTGDVVVEEPGGYRFVGRRDRMVKRRGYRVELGEIEAALAANPEVREAAAVAESLPDLGVRIHAFLSPRDGGKLSVLALKRFCAERLPRYMVPDVFHSIDALPRTSTDKIDYQGLKGRLVQ